MLFVCVARSLEDYFELININIDAFLGMFFKEITVNERNRFIKEFKVQSIRNEDDKLEEHRTGSHSSCLLWNRVITRAIVFHTAGLEFKSHNRSISSISSSHTTYLVNHKRNKKANHFHSREKFSCLHCLRWFSN